MSVCPGWTINVVGFVNGNYDKFIGVDLRSDVSRTLVETASIDYAANWLVRGNLLLLRSWCLRCGRRRMAVVDFNLHWASNSL